MHSRITSGLLHLCLLCIVIDKNASFFVDSNMVKSAYIVRPEFEPDGRQGVWLVRVLFGEERLIDEDFVSNKQEPP